MSQELQLVTHKVKSANAERRWHNGREYLVAPVIPIVEGVLNGALVPAEEIRDYFEAWNGVLVPLGHPRRNGEYVSANTLEIEAECPGRFWSATFETDRLKGEFWIDVAKAEALGGDAVVAMERLEAGEPIEVSTAYWRDIELMSGEWNGVPYRSIDRNLRPDHIAILLDEIGACSWQDGCGTPRVNKGGLVGNSKGTVLNLNGKSLVANQQDGVMVALFPSEEAVQVFARVEGFPGEATVPEMLHLTLGYFGTTEELGEWVDLGYALQDLAGFASRMPVVPADISGYARFFGEEETDAIVSLIESPYLQEWRTQLLYLLEYSGLWARSNHRFTPHVTLGYAASNAAMPADLPSAQPVVFDRLGFAWGGQVTLFGLQGEAMTVAEETDGEMASNREVTKRGGLWQRLKGVFNREHETDVEPVEANTEVEDCMCDKQGGTVAVNAGNTGSVAPEVVKTEPAGQELDIAAIVKNAVSEGLAPYKGVLETIQANAEQERNELISALASNERCPFDEAELKEFDTPKLQKLADAWQEQPAANYGGRGGPRTHARGDIEELLEMPDFSSNGNGGK